jgi:hypothetical protein
MSSDRDVTRIVRSWLEEGVTALPDRVLDSVLDQVPATRQRRAWWPARRFADMNTYAKLAIAAAAALIIAVVAINLLPRSGGVGGDASPSPSPTTSPTPSPAPTAAAVVPPAGPLATGRHSLTLGGVQLSIEIPTDGWISNGQFGIDKGNMDALDSAGFIFWIHSAPDNVYADPCAKTPLSPPPGSLAAELAAAVSNIPGIDLVSGPSDVTVGGRPAKHVVVSIPDDIGCDPNDFYLWYDADTPGDARYATEVGSTIYTWIIEADETRGTLVWIDAETYTASGPAAEQEVQQIIDSIRFD